MRRFVNLCLILALVAGCSGSSRDNKTDITTPAPSAPATNVSMNKDGYPVFPNADAGADPSVPADQGGRGEESFHSRQK